MLIKFLFLLSIFFLRNVQVTSSVKLKDGEFSLVFDISSTKSCATNKTIKLKTGDQFSFAASKNHYINKATCANDHEPNKFFNISDLHQGTNNTMLVFPTVNITKQHEGTWICQFLTLKDIVHVQSVSIDDNRYVRIVCYANIIVDQNSSDSNQKHSSESTNIKEYWVYIVSGVSILMLVIFIIQCGCIIHFRKKGKRPAGLETLSKKYETRDSKDNKRYSSTPGLHRGKMSWLRLLNKSKGERIYETLEEIQTKQVPPTPPIETIPSHNKSKSDIDISRRPPLPIPEECLNENYEEPTNVTERTIISKPVPSISPKPEVPEMKLPPFIPDTKRNRAIQSLSAHDTPEPAMIPQTQKILKTGNPLPVLSELDNILKKQQNFPASTLLPPKKPPQDNDNKKRISVFGTLTNPKNRAASCGSKPPPRTPPSKMSLPDIKPSPLTKKPVIATKPDQPPQPKHQAILQPAVATKPAPITKPKPCNMKPGLATTTATKPPLPTPVQVQGPTTTSKLPMPSLVEVQVPASIPPALPPPNPIQEPFYEVYEEEPNDDYNSDEEWTYERLPQMNIYSI